MRNGRWFCSAGETKRSKEITCRNLREHFKNNIIDINSSLVYSSWRGKNKVFSFTGKLLEIVTMVRETTKRQSYVKDERAKRRRIRLMIMENFILCLDVYASPDNGRIILYTYIYILLYIFFEKNKTRNLYNIVVKGNEDFEIFEEKLLPDLMIQKLFLISKIVFQRVVF